MSKRAAAAAMEQKVVLAKQKRRRLDVAASGAYGTSAAPEAKVAPLPRDMWLMVLAFLEFHELFGIWSRVTKAGGSLIWLSIGLRSTLSVARIVPDAVLALLCECRRIRSLSMQTFLQPQEVQSLCSSLPGLQNLELAGYNLSLFATGDVATPGSFQLRSASLTSLCIASGGNLRDAQFAELVTCLPQLTAFTFGSCGGISDVGFVAGFVALARGMPQLTTLYLDRCFNLTDLGFAVIRESMPRLAVLRLGWCLMLTDHALIALAAHAAGRKLTKLYLSHCASVTDVGLAALAAEGAMPRLTTLKICHLTSITDAGVIALATGMPQLTSVDISLCVAVTDAGLFALANGLPGLRRLDLSGCILLTDAGLRAAFTGSNLSNLMWLGLDGCVGMTQAGVLAVLKLPRQNRLEIHCRFN
jgi:hypothetical protein